MYTKSKQINTEKMGESINNKIKKIETMGINYQNMQSIVES